MTYRVKVKTATGQQYFYAIGGVALDSLLDRLYSVGPIGVSVSSMA